MIGAWMARRRGRAKPSCAMPSISASQLRGSAQPRAGWPPSATYCSSAASSAATTCVGGVKRHCVVFSMYDPLVVQVEHQRGGVALAFLQSRFSGSSTKPIPGGPSRHLPEAATSASNGLARVDRQRAERAHRVDDQAASVLRHDGRDLVQRIEDAGAGLAVHQRDMRDRRILRQRGVDVRRRSPAGVLVVDRR